jgi:hypothetical protein
MENVLCRHYCVIVIIIIIIAGVALLFLFLLPFFHQMWKASSANIREKPGERLVSAIVTVPVKLYGMNALCAIP